MLGNDVFYLAAQVVALFAIPLSAIGILAVAGEQALSRGAGGEHERAGEPCRCRYRVRHR
jgi:hypothetical protein